MAYQQYRPSSFKLLPMVIKNLFIINALFLLATFVMDQRMGVDLNEVFGLHLFNSEKFKPWQLITYMFMHADITHLFSNMISLLIFGAALENYWGSKKFLIYYLLTGIGAALLHYMILYIDTFAPVINLINYFPGFVSHEQFKAFFETLPGLPFSEGMNRALDQYNTILNTGADPYALSHAAADLLAEYKIALLNIPTIVGASGSVFGVLLAYGMTFPNSYPLLFIPLPAKWIVFIYGAAELLAEFQGRADGIAHIAHLGGMLFGFLLIKFWNRKRNHF
jgi:membrane associated rhomboid family serine protease